MWWLGTIFQDNLPWLLFVFVPLQIGSRGTDTRNIGSAIFIEIRDGAGRGGHTALVEDALLPAGLVPAINKDAATGAAKTRDNLIVSITVEIGCCDGVAVDKRIIDHLSVPI